MRVQCRTFFDITATGVTGHFKPSRMPFSDLAGTVINTTEKWNRARNQQRNWETITQIISLRTQVDFSLPEKTAAGWVFEFEFVNDHLFAIDQDPLAVLKNDCVDVPMILDLGETDTINTVLTVNKNIWFDVLPINIE
ncbi:hypothetical protein UFOVP328_333 [uncultured Caudovirales phage]|uniref:Uncharacterized protein n=1 Tax=uncultured Caudovirales phage TaxID=2100421 RepID=A0A6J5LZH3_9CAUD|nr:hypothetical protein UFOVP328_333 [uncultured Caudovirales phage]